MGAHECSICGDRFNPVFSTILCLECHQQEIDHKLGQKVEVDDIDREFYLDSIGG